MAARTPFSRYIRSKLLYPFQAALAHIFFFIVRLLPLNFASGIGGLIGRMIGPRLGVTNLARTNLKKIFPEKSNFEIELIINNMWDNLGRTLFEFPQIDRLRFYEDDTHVEIIGAENIDLLNSDERPGIFYTAHLANWELAALAVVHRGMPLHVFYRMPNNDLLESLYHKRRPQNLGILPKGALGARNAISLLKKGEHLGMLLDQKMNDGISVPFFGRDAMTAPAMAQFALKYKCPIVPVQVERLVGVKFRITFHPPVEYSPSSDHAKDVKCIMTDVNECIEKWIRQNPDQWLWVHNRWPDKSN
jgi:Kdo2-lipid IVA lauroyltransferase/acyltransferase